MAGHDIVAVGSSAGGVEALTSLCAGLPADFPAAVLVVQHVSPISRSVLPQLLGRAGPLKVDHAVDGEAIIPGRIYVAPPGIHLLIEDGHVLLRRGPPENRTRPAIDPLFRSVAIAYGPRAIGVVLTGVLDDGSAGLKAIKQCGGVSVVQDPLDAAWPEMPRNALLGDHADHVVTLANLPALLIRLANEPPGPAVDVPPHLIAEARAAAQEAPLPDHLSRLSHPNHLTCPRCGGVLNEIAGDGAAQFRSQVGHAFTAEGLAAAQADELERALESAARMHRDRVVLFRRLQQLSEGRSLRHSAERWRAGAEESERAANLISEAVRLLHKPDAG
jgi:two-component system chemotaxis response regulator CheB